MNPNLLVAWVLRFTLAVGFLYFAFMHAFDPGYAAQFVVWGYPAGWQTLTAVGEAIGAILVLIPSMTLLGVALLGIILLAAIGTLLVHGATLAAVIPLGFLVAVLALGWLRWSDRV